MHKTPVLLRRWAAQFPGSRYPSTATDLSVEQRMHLEKNDPELGMILSGTAPVELELAVMENTLADSIPNAAERQAADNAAEAQRLISEGAFGRPGFYAEDGSYVEPIEANLSAMMRVAQLDPQAYQRAHAAANPPKADPNAMTAEQRAFVQEQLAEQAEARLLSLQAAGDFGYGE